MGHHEKIWLNNYLSSEGLFYGCYVDDTFCLFHIENYAPLFFDYINTRHPNMSFMMEKVFEKKLQFLDIMLHNGHLSLFTAVFRERTLTGLVTNYFSFAPLSHKLGLVRTLVDRVHKIKNTWLGFHGDIKLTMILR